MTEKYVACLDNKDLESLIRKNHSPEIALKIEAVSPVYIGEGQFRVDVTYTYVTVEEQITAEIPGAYTSLIQP